MKVAYLVFAPDQLSQLHGTLDTGPVKTVTQAIAAEFAVDAHVVVPILEHAQQGDASIQDLAIGVQVCGDRLRREDPDAVLVLGRSARCARA